VSKFPLRDSSSFHTTHDTRALLDVFPRDVDLFHPAFQIGNVTFCLFGVVRASGNQLMTLRAKDHHNIFSFVRQSVLLRLYFDVDVIMRITPHVTRVQTVVLFYEEEEKTFIV